MTIARNNLDALTGLRFVAAFVIVIGHLYPPWLEITGIGMPLFFTLSGFIIHYVYGEAFSKGWRGAAGDFAVARFSRIYPLYLAFLFFYLARTPWGKSLETWDNLPVLVAFLTGTWTWFPFRVHGQLLLDSMYHISWSVSTEVFFYLAYAAVLYRLGGLRNFRGCLALLIGFCLATYLMFYVIYLTRDGWEATLLRDFPGYEARTPDFALSLYRWLLYVSPYARIFEFIGGVLTCQLYRLISQRSAAAERLNTSAMAWVAFVALIITFGFFRYYGEFNPWLAVGNHSFPGFIVNLHMNFLFAPACYLLIFSLALGGGAMGRVLASRPAGFLGDISYSTYLSHPWVDYVLQRMRLDFSSTVPHLVLSVVVIYIMSWVLYTVIEVPAKRWLRWSMNTIRRPARFSYRL